MNRKGKAPSTGAFGMLKSLTKALKVHVGFPVTGSTIVIASDVPARAAVSKA